MSDSLDPRDLHEAVSSAAKSLRSVLEGSGKPQTPDERFAVAYMMGAAAALESVAAGDWQAISGLAESGPPASGPHEGIS